MNVPIPENGSDVGDVESGAGPVRVDRRKRATRRTTRRRATKTRKRPSPFKLALVTAATAVLLEFAQSVPTIRAALMRYYFPTKEK